MEHARWLLGELKKLKALEGLDNVEIQPTEEGCRFQISNADERTLASLETALEQIPDVELMLSPEAF
jgi:hypothetical protein